MRHTHSQSSSSLLFLVGSLVLTLSLASNNSYAGEKSGTGGDMREAFPGDVLRIGTKSSEAMKKAAAERQAKYNKAFGKASREAYAKLSAEEKKMVQDITDTAEAEYGAEIDRNQLVGFVSFIKANPSATCSVSAGNRENSKAKYSVFTSEKDKKKYGGGMSISSLFGGGSKAGLLCTAGSTKMFFTGLPARPLNDYYNTNIALKSETTAPVVADSTTTTPAPIPVPSSTQVTGYMTQSTEELKTEQEQTAFEGAPATIEVDAPSKLGFSKPAK